MSIDQAKNTWILGFGLMMSCCRIWIAAVTVIAAAVKVKVKVKATTRKKHTFSPFCILFLFNDHPYLSVSFVMNFGDFALAPPLKINDVISICRWKWKNVFLIFVLVFLWSFSVQQTIKQQRWPKPAAEERVPAICHWPKATHHWRRWNPYY